MLYINYNISALPATQMHNINVWKIRHIPYNSMLDARIKTGIAQFTKESLDF